MLTRILGGNVGSCGRRELTWRTVCLQNPEAVVANVAKNTIAVAKTILLVAQVQVSQATNKQEEARSKSD